MRHLVWTSLVLGLMGAWGCGDSGGDPGDKKDDDDDTESKIVFPDSICDDESCVANADNPGACDPNASDPDLEDCTAWRINGTFSLTAVAVNQDGKRGAPPKIDRTDDDPCPPNSKVPEGKEKADHCCERVEMQPAQPAYMLTGITLLDPPVFRLPSVSNTNKTAIEEDRYNWIMQLSSDQPGEITIKSGLGLQNEDGSFAFAEGPFELGGVMWNKNGEWNPHEVKGVLGADGNLKYAGQYIPQGRFFDLPLWGAGYSYTQMVLSMTGIEMDIDLSADKLCAGYLTGNKTFDQIGKIKAYLPLKELRDVKLHFDEGDEGIGLCSLTAGVAPGECDKPLSEWGK